MKDLQIYTNEQLISILRNICKAGARKYNEENSVHIYKVFKQLYNNQKDKVNILGTSALISRLGVRIYVPIYEEALLSQIGKDLSDRHERNRLIPYEKLSKLIDIADSVEKELVRTENSVIEAYKNLSNLTTPLFNKIVL